MKRIKNPDRVFPASGAVRQLARCATMTAKRYVRPRPITKRDDPPDILFPTDESSVGNGVLTVLRVCQN
jgi:hypothetical protein